MVKKENATVFVYTTDRWIIVKKGKGAGKTTRIKMARRRDRRTVPSSDHRRVRVEVSNRQDQLNDSTSDRKLMIIFTVFFIVLPGASILVYRMKYPPRGDRPDPYISPNPLVKTDVSYLEILAVSTERCLCSRGLCSPLRLCF